MIDVQPIHQLIQLSTLPLVRGGAIISELHTESTSMLFFTSIDPDERREELGTDGGGGIEGGRRISVIDLFDVAVVIVGDEEGLDEE